MMLCHGCITFLYVSFTADRKYAAEDTRVPSTLRNALVNKGLLQRNIFIFSKLMKYRQDADYNPSFSSRNPILRNREEAVQAA